MLLAGGTGSPHFTTDTTAALRAAEIGAEVLLKATKVDGIYSADPKVDKTAKRFKRISYSEVLRRKLKVMDLTAISMCMDSQLPIVVFDVKKEGKLLRGSLRIPRRRHRSRRATVRRPSHRAGRRLARRIERRSPGRGCSRPG